MILVQGTIVNGSVVKVSVVGGGESWEYNSVAAAVIVTSWGSLSWQEDRGKGGSTVRYDFFLFRNSNKKKVSYRNSVLYLKKEKKIVLYQYGKISYRNFVLELVPQKIK